MNNKILMGIGVVIVVLVGGYFLMANKTQPDLAIESKAAEENPVVTEAMEKNLKTVTVTVTASSFKFDPVTITVKKGDTVKLTLKNSGGMHDWVVDEFNARTKQLKSGEEETINFVADKAGSFEYYCSVGNHREMGMKGTLIVE